VVYFKRYNGPPSRIALFGLVVYAGIWLVAPVEVSYRPSFESLALLLVTFATLYGAIVLFERTSPRRRNVPPIWVRPESASKVARFLKLISFLVVVGIAFRLIDRFVIRDVSLVATAIERYEQTRAAGWNVFSLASSFLYPLSVPLYLYITRARLAGIVVPSAVAVIASIGFWFFALDVALIGKRGAILLVVTLFILSNWHKIKTQGLRSLAKFALVILGLIVVSYEILGERVAFQNSALAENIFSANYAELVQPSSVVTDAVKDLSGTGVLLDTYAAFVNFAIYYTHGMYEFAYLIDHREAFSPQYGRFTFDAALKPFAAIGLLTLHAPSDILPRSGVYTTFAGPLFIDFFFFVPIVVAFFAWGVVKLWVASLYRPSCYPLYQFLVACLLFAPVVNLIDSGLGIYILVASGVFMVLERNICGKNPFCRGAR